MSETIHFRSEDKSEYSIKVVDGAIYLDWYYPGSIYGGTGTEGQIGIGKEKVTEFLNSMNFEDISDFTQKIKNYDDNQWSNLRQVMRQFSTGSWTWSETDWS